MLIGAIIGLAIYSVIVVINLGMIRAEVNRHNNGISGRLKGRARVIIHYGQIVITSIAWMSVGAVIGYFI